MVLHLAGVRESLDVLMVLLLAGVGVRAWSVSSGVRELLGVLTVLRLAGVGGVLVQCDGGNLCARTLWPRGQMRATLHPFDNLSQKVAFMMHGTFPYTRAQVVSTHSSQHDN